MPKPRKSTHFIGGARSFYCELLTSTLGAYIPETQRTAAQQEIWDKIIAFMETQPADVSYDHVIIHVKQLLRDLFGDQAMLTPPKKVPPPPDYSAEKTKYEKLLAIGPTVAYSWLAQQNSEVIKAVQEKCAAPNFDTEIVKYKQLYEVDSIFANTWLGQQPFTVQEAITQSYCKPGGAIQSPEVLDETEIEQLCCGLGLPKQVVKDSVLPIAKHWGNQYLRKIYSGQTKINDVLCLLVGMFNIQEHSQRGLQHSGGCTIWPRKNVNATIRDHTDIVWSPNGRAEVTHVPVTVKGLSGEIEMYIIPSTPELLCSPKQVLFWYRNSAASIEEKFYFDITPTGLRYTNIPISTPVP